MEKNDVDEKLIKWNDIFEELIIDAKTLVKDLSESINYIGVFAIIALFIGGAALAIGFDRGGKYIAVGFIIFSTCATSAIIQLWKWYRLRKRYNRLQSRMKELESN